MLSASSDCTQLGGEMMDVVGRRMDGVFGGRAGSGEGQTGPRRRRRRLVGEGVGGAGR